MSTLIALTGAGGFVGRAVLALAAQAQVPVRALTRTPAALPGAAEIVPLGPFEAVDEAGFSAALAGCSAVIHAAGVAHVEGAADAHEAINHRASARLAAAAAGLTMRFVFLSSVRAQAGASSGVILRETAPCLPTDAYGRAKLAAEEAIRACGTAHVILRPPLVIGAPARANLAALLRLAALPLPLPFAGLTGRRSLIALEDLAALALAGARGSLPAGTYLAADPQPLTLGAMIAHLRDGMGRRPALFSLPTGALHAALRAAGGPELVARLDGDLIAEPAALLRAGWTPGLPAGEALRRLGAAHRRRGSP